MPLACLVKMLKITSIILPYLRVIPKISEKWRCKIVLLALSLQNEWSFSTVHGRIFPSYLFTAKSAVFYFVHSPWYRRRCAGNREKLSLDKEGRSDRDIVYSLKFIGIHLRWSDLPSLTNYAVQKYFICSLGVCEISKLLCVKMSWINAM